MVRHITQVSEPPVQHVAERRSPGKEWCCIWQVYPRVSAFGNGQKDVQRGIDPQKVMQPLQRLIGKRHWTRSATELFQLGLIDAQ